MSSPIPWGKVPSRADANRPPTAASDPRRVVPWSPKESTVVWFLGDAERCPTHYVSDTVPCRGANCTHCQNQVRIDIVGYAPVLIPHHTIEGRLSWYARVLRIGKRNLESLGDELRGKRFRIEVKGVSGKRKSSTHVYHFVNHVGLSIPTFDVRPVMEDVWGVALHDPLLFDPISEDYVKPVAVVPTVAKSFAEQLLEMKDAELLDLVPMYRTGEMPRQLAAIVAELHNRGLTIPATNPKPVPSSSPGELVVGNAGTVSFKRKGDAA